jgi:hypothetical protein
LREISSLNSIERFFEIFPLTEMKGASRQVGWLVKLSSAHDHLPQMMIMADAPYIGDRACESSVKAPWHGLRILSTVVIERPGASRVGSIRNMRSSPLEDSESDIGFGYHIRRSNL